MYKCKFCFKEFEASKIGGHIKWCEKNPKRNEYLKQLKFTRENISSEARKKQSARIKKAWEEGKYINSNHDGFKGKHHSEETKKQMSQLKKEWIIKNKDKFNWNFNKKKSVPCEIIKKQLISLNISFAEEYIPFEKKLYAIDIAFPDKKIGIEINGNQHYDSKGDLTPYYQERHNFIESNGWKLYEFHFSLVYNENIIKNITEILNKSDIIIPFDYDFWILNPKTKKDKREKIKIEKNKIKTEKTEIIKNQLLNSNINFSKFGWVNSTSKIIGCKYQKVNKWIKINMLEFYNEKCFKRN